MMVPLPPPTLVGTRICLPCTASTRLSIRSTPWLVLACTCTCPWPLLPLTGKTNASCFLLTPFTFTALEELCIGMEHSTPLPSAPLLSECCRSNLDTALCTSARSFALSASASITIPPAILATLPTNPPINVFPKTLSISVFSLSRRSFLTFDSSSTPSVLAKPPPRDLAVPTAALAVYFNSPKRPPVPSLFAGFSSTLQSELSSFFRLPLS
mmetsp:Transcript_22003/g.48913  ORF Transcript_22003/g.48913 Transcript_22003/m.48913 type:complete len:212 (-) Transcript_22003:227-862(-)